MAFLDSLRTLLQDIPLVSDSIQQSQRGVVSPGPDLSHAKPSSFGMPARQYNRFQPPRPYAPQTFNRNDMRGMSAPYFTPQQATGPADPWNSIGASAQWPHTPQPIFQAPVTPDFSQGLQGGTVNTGYIPLQGTYSGRYY